MSELSGVYHQISMVRQEIEDLNGKIFLMEEEIQRLNSRIEELEGR